MDRILFNRGSWIALPMGDAPLYHSITSTENPFGR